MGGNAMYQIQVVVRQNNIEVVDKEFGSLAGAVLWLNRFAKLAKSIVLRENESLPERRHKK